LDETSRSEDQVFSGETKRFFVFTGGCDSQPVEDGHVRYVTHGRRDLSLSVLLAEIKRIVFEKRSQGQHLVLISYHRILVKTKVIITEPGPHGTSKLAMLLF